MWLLGFVNANAQVWLQRYQIPKQKRLEQLAQQMHLPKPQLSAGAYEVRIWHSWSFEYGDAHMLYVLRKTPTQFSVSRFDIYSDETDFQYATPIVSNAPECINTDLWKMLVQLGILTMPDQVTVERRRKENYFRKYPNAKFIEEIVVTDGEGFSFETFSASGRRYYSYRNPKSYAQYYTDVPEFKRVVKILTILSSLFPPIRATWLIH